MGAAESQGIYSQIDLHHPALRNCQALIKNNLTFLQCSMTCQLPQYEQWKQDIKASNFHEADTDYLLMPLKHKFEEGGVCSTAGELTIEYDYYPKLLSVEIRDRIKDNRKFTEAELWYLLYVMVSAREAMILQGMEVGDLQPKNVFLNANQQAKIACQLSWPGYLSSFKRAVLQEGFDYLSPEDIVRLKLGAMDNKNNSESQVFAMGLTLLSASCLQPMKDIFRVRERDIDQELFGARLAVFQQDRNYSDIYRAVVCNLLEVDPLKRMNQQQLGQFLFKHRQNLEKKKPLMFDNVGKKLQQSINSLLKVAPQPLSGSAFRGSRTNSKSKDGQGSNQHINYQDLNQQSFRQSGARSVDKNKPPIINFEFSGSGVKIPVSPTQQRKIVFNNPPSTGNIPPSIPLYTPPKAMNNIHQPPKNVEIYQTGSRAEPPKMMYRPFDNITAVSPKMTELPGMVEESKVQQIAAIDRGLEEGQERSTVNQLLMETRKGGFLVEMSKVQRKDKKKQNQDSPSFVKDEKGSSIVLENNETKIQKLIEEKTEVKPENHLKKIESHEEVQKIEQNEEKKKSILEQKIELKSEESIKEEPKKQVDFSHGKQVEEKKEIQKIVESSQKKKKIESVQIIKIGTSEQNSGGKTNSNSQSRVSNDSKATDNKFSPSIKIWGMQKGKLTVQEVGTSQPYVPKSIPGPQLQTPNTVSIEVKQREVEKVKSEKTSQPSTQSKPTTESVNELAVISPSLEEISTKKQNEIQAASTVEKKKEELISPTLEEAAEKKQNSAAYNDRYILIEESSRVTSEMTQHMDPPQKIDEKHFVQEQKVTQQNPTKENNSREPMTHSRQRSGSFVRSNATQKTNFIFSEISTDGTFDQCWEELIKAVKEPQSYSHLIKPEKVDPFQNEYGQFLRVGPARMKVNLNKEQGKIWLQGLPSSICQGDIFCGVVKKEDKQNYLWMNSSLTYKGTHFPPIEVIEQGLQVAERNIKRKNHAE